MSKPDTMSKLLKGKLDFSNSKAHSYIQKADNSEYYAHFEQQAWTSSIEFTDWDEVYYCLKFRQNSYTAIVSH